MNKEFADKRIAELTEEIEKKKALFNKIKFDLDSAEKRLHYFKRIAEGNIVIGVSDYYGFHIEYVEPTLIVNPTINKREGGVKFIVTMDEDLKTYKELVYVDRNANFSFSTSELLLSLPRYDYPI